LKENSERHLVTGGAGFLGSHLIDRLIEKGDTVFCLDNFYTGSDKNIKHWFSNPNFELLSHNVVENLELNVDRIWHLACPASPLHYQRDPIETARTNFLGTYNMLELARKNKSKILFASTSEIYGDPEVHPQPETYKGSVNPIGIRSCYDEGKRIGETLCFDYYRIHKLEIRVMRIFNTYGPRMLPNDGRVVSNFIVQALTGNDLTIYGDGSQTRSFCYVDDLIDGMVALMNSNSLGPINIGNDREFTVLDLAEKVREKIDPKLKIVFKDLPEDDPLQRKPVLTRALDDLNWQPKINLDEGLDKTINYFRHILGES
tara:strand:+ start:17715 stop:18662 length:948 start_codon:yes stop_codon:yes gene_type:complete